MIHTIWLKYGSTETKRFMSNIQYIANHWILHHGFTVGIADTITSKYVQTEVRRTIQESEDNVKQLISVSKHSNNPDLFEKKINQVLNNAMAISGRIVQDAINRNNNINTMVSGGSKGSVINIAQIMGVVGQQNVSGGRITLGYEGRTLCHFEKNDNNPAPKGFIKNSYYKGLEPHEFFYHAMSGREGITDTAVKTADTGYIQRRLIKSMEDLKISFDGSVRNSIGDIVQFNYGDDRLNAVYLQKITFTLPMLGTKQFTDMFTYPEVSIEELQFFQQYHISNETSITFLSPINMEYYNLEETYYIDDDVISYDTWTSEMNHLTNYLIYDKNIILRELKQSNINLILYIRVHLCSKNVIHKWRMSTYRFKQIIQKIITQYEKSKIPQGEMIGTLAAQSLGEPTTQLTLNSFHFTGISAKNITLGVPRFKELINVLKHVKTPSMNVFTKPGMVEELSLHLECCNLKDLIEDIDLIYVDDIEEDISWIERSYHNTGIKLRLKKRNIIEHNISLLDIIISIFKANLDAVSSSELSEEIYIIIFVPIQSDDEMQDVDDIINKSLKKINIKGMQEITKCYISDQSIIETDGSCLQKVMCLTDVDSTKTTCNIPTEVLEVLGVEAARNVLLKEIKKVLEFDGGYINNRHFQTLVDTMTYKGTIMSITRHGINKTTQDL